VSYASIADFFRLGIRPAALIQQPRTVVSVDVAADSLFQPMHGFAPGDPLRLSPQGVGGVPPAGTNATTVYYAVPLTGDTFQLATSAANATAPVPIVVDITGLPTGVLATIADVEPMIQSQLDKDSQVIDGALISYGTPLPTPYPFEVVEVNCHLSAFHLAATFGFLTPATPTQDSILVSQRYKAAKETLEAWRKGRLLDPGVTDATPNVEENAASTDVIEVPDWLTPGVAI
jgi:hypothetical protein